MNISSSIFDSNKFNSFDSGKSYKILTGEKLSKKEAVDLGKKLDSIEKKTLTTRVLNIQKIALGPNEDQLIAKTDSYVKLKQIAMLVKLHENLDALDLIHDPEIQPLISKLDYESGRGQNVTSLFGALIDVLALKQDGPQLVDALFDKVMGRTDIEKLKANSSLHQRERLLALINHGREVGLPLHLLHRAGTIANQAKNYPTILMMIVSIRNQLGKLDELLNGNNVTNGKNQEHVKLQEEITRQYNNLRHLSDIVASLSKNNERAAALMQLNPQLMQGTVDPLLLQVIEGSADLEDASVRSRLKESLRSTLDTIAAEQHDANTSEKIAKMRRKASVKGSAIIAQHGLMEAKRQGQKWASFENTLKPLDESTNIVYRLKDPNIKGKVTAFLKVGAGGEEAAGTMETMVWDLALHLGLEELFAATGETEIHVGSESSESSEPRDNVVLKGGLQPAVRGEKLADFMDMTRRHTSLLSQQEVMRGIVASIVFGMNDATGDNIIVRPEKVAPGIIPKGKIKFFDNTRSLPNSNELMFTGNGEYIVPFRCALLNLPQAHTRISEREQKELLAMLKGIEKKLDSAEQFMKSRSTRAKIAKMPPGWMDSLSSFQAMRERVDMLTHTLQTVKKLTMEDLAGLSIKNYKFAFALQLLEQMETGSSYTKKGAEEICRFNHELVGLGDMRKMMIRHAARGFDVKGLYEMCKDQSLGFRELTNTILKMDHDRKKNGPAPLKREKLIKEANELAKAMTARAVPDFKDFARESSVKSTIEYNSALLQRHGYKLLEVEEDEIPFERMEGDRVILKDPHKPGYQIAVKKEQNWQVQRIDLSDYPGKIKSQGKLIAMDIFLKEFEG